MFKAKDYSEAIQRLLAGLGQLSPDGNPCAICGDSGHQAWECHHNPLVIMKRLEDFENGRSCGAPFSCTGCPDWYKASKHCQTINAEAVPK